MGRKTNAGQFASSGFSLSDINNSTMGIMSKKTETELLECSHCGNKTPHAKVFEYLYPMLFDEMDDQRYTEEYRWLGFACATCGGLNLYGDFIKYPTSRDLGRSKLYPKGFDLAPPSRILNPAQPLPDTIAAIYEQIWPLRQRSPAAFIGQIKRLMLEVCDDQQIEDGLFADRMKNLLSVERCPASGLDTTHELVDAIANMGVSISDGQLSLWDVHAADEFFRLVMDTVYFIPARIRKLSRQIRTSNS